MKRTLYQQVHETQNLFSAWRHVKRSALNSPNREIRGEASEFEHVHQRHINRIQRQLRERRYKFGTAYGALKDKEKREAVGKAPRPIAISKMQDRVVQRAILQVLQPRRVENPKDPNSKAVLLENPQLGNVNKINRSRYGVGGLLKPYGGAKPAIKLLLEAMSAGALVFYKSDIKAFFTDIPVMKVVDILRQQTRDDEFCDLFHRAVTVELENPEELKSYADLFPSDDIGVAQGGSLSAFSGNVLLYDLDHDLNTAGVTSVRYIDDLIILAESEEKLSEAIEIAQSGLSDFGFSLYFPGKDKSKADRGLCAHSFQFLGCTLQPNRCVPSKESIDKKLREFSEMISASQGAIQRLVKDGKPIKKDQTFALTTRRIGEKLYGWQKSFNFCTDIHEFDRIDNKTSDKIAKYNQFVQREVKKLDTTTAARVLGIPSAKEGFLADQAKALATS